MALLEIGDVIGNYEILGEYGQGGMGVVVAGLHQEDDLIYAIKYCATEDEASLQRFRREVRLMAGIEHQHVVPVVDSDLDHSPPYFVMPSARWSLADELPLPEAGALDAFRQICLGVEAIHLANTTHRDLKPANILRLDDDRLAVSDLGLAKRDVRDTPFLTDPGAWLGTVPYMAPEQMYEARDVDARADIYSLGKVLYEMITGEKPHLIEPTRVSPGLRYVIERATAQRPEERFATVNALLESITAYELTQNRNAHPATVFNALLQQARELIEDGRYDPTNVQQLRESICDEGNEPARIIEMFEALPEQLLYEMAANLPEPTEAIVSAYAGAVDQLTGDRNFEHADVIARKMSAVFHNASADRPRLAALAIKVTLRAALAFHRFNAMDEFDRLLQAVVEPAVAIAVAEMLSERADDYRRLADRVPDNELHAAIRRVKTRVLAQVHVR